jgi:hypothetical protein
MRTSVKVRVFGPITTGEKAPLFSGPAGISAVSLEWLKRYSSPKPLRRPPTPKEKKS